MEKNKIDRLIHEMPDWEVNIHRSADKANHHLNGRLNDLRHLMNDQLIELKYGKGYKLKFLDEILIMADSL